MVPASPTPHIPHHATAASPHPSVAIIATPCAHLGLLARPPCALHLSCVWTALEVAPTVGSTSPPILVGLCHRIWALQYRIHRASPCSMWGPTLNVTTRVRSSMPSVGRCRGHRRALSSSPCRSSSLDPGPTVSVPSRLPLLIVGSPFVVVAIVLVGRRQAVARGCPSGPPSPGGHRIWAPPVAHRLWLVRRRLYRRHPNLRWQSQSRLDPVPNLVAVGPIPPPPCRPSCRCPLFRVPPT
jgi:hypothetical protein